MTKKQHLGPKVLVFDIETAPIIAHVWGLWENNVGLNQIVKDWHVLSWSAKWLHEKEVMYMDQRNEKKVENDKKILEKIWQLLDEADVVVTQNGIKFDVKKLNARFFFHGLQKPSPFRHIDTKRVASRNFAFTSNKLEYMSDKFNTKYKKLKHKDFPGHELWTECLKGNLKAWKTMEKYNKYDVLALEELYYKMVPWDNSINFSAFNDGKFLCTCNGTKLIKWGFRLTNIGKYQRFKCADCGKSYNGSENLIKVRTRIGG